MMEDRFLKRLRKKARKGVRGWQIATLQCFLPLMRLTARHQASADQPGRTSARRRRGTHG
jgi:hypothetical protein